MTSSYTELCSTSESTITRDKNSDEAFKVLKLFNLTHQRLERTASSFLFFPRRHCRPGEIDWNLELDSVSFCRRNDGFLVTVSNDSTIIQSV